MNQTETALGCPDQPAARRGPQTEYFSANCSLFVPSSTTTSKLPERQISTCSVLLCACPPRVAPAGVFEDVEQPLISNGTCC